jgi:hypothetical protein
VPFSGKAHKTLGGGSSRNRVIPMQDDHIQCVDDTNQIVLPWQSVSAEAAMPYQGHRVGDHAAGQLGRPLLRLNCIKFDSDTI